MTAASPTVWQRLRFTRLRDVFRGRFDASLDWRLIVSDANLPAEISDTICQIVRGTRLWRSEKVDVARELVAHFQDGLDAGHSPEALLKSFGEPRQTAQLIRPAKIRNRSLAWHFWRYACWAMGAVVVIYVGTALYMTMDRPSIATDYLAMLNERAALVPEAKRAWPLYRDALLELNVKSAEFDPAQPLTAAPMANPADGTWAETQKFLVDHADSLAKLREAAARPDLGFVTATTHASFCENDRKLFGVAVSTEDIEAAKKLTVQDRWAISTLLPYLNLLRPAAALLASDASRAAIAGDGNTALADISAIYGISRHCEEIPTMVSELVAEVVQCQARNAIQQILRDQPELWTNDQLRDLAHIVAARRIDWKRGFLGEHICFYDSMQRLYTDDGNGDGRLALNVSRDQNLFELLNSITTQVSDRPTSTPLSNTGLAMLAIPAANFAVASRKDMTQTYERFSDRALKLLETPLWETTNEPSDEEVLSELSGQFGKFHYLFVNLLLPAYDVVRYRCATSDGERDGVLIGLALELYHREQGKWPESLTELSPRWLPQLPVDRITGESLKYKVFDERPIVYSMGVDGDDDGGRLPDGCDGDATTYRVSPPSEATDDIPDWRDGDWVIWSTMKQTSVR